MTNNAFKAAVITIIKNSIGAEVYVKLNRLTNAGCIDIESIKENDYSQAKAAAYAILKDIAEEVRPLSKEGRKEVENIAKFI